jgi:hypothetical protein
MQNDALINQLQENDKNLILNQFPVIIDDLQ